MIKQPELVKNSIIYFNGEYFIILTMSGYRARRHDYSRKEFILTNETSDRNLGMAAIEAANASRFVTPDDTDFYSLDKLEKNHKIWLEDKLKKLNIKTKTTFLKSLIMCNLIIKDGLITIKPSHHDRLEAWSGSGITRENDVIIPSSADFDKTGAGIRLAFTRCKSKF